MKHRNPVLTKWTIVYRRKNKKLASDKKKRVQIRSKLSSGNERTIGGWTKDQLKERSQKISEEEKIEREEKFKKALEMKQQMFKSKRGYTGRNSKASTGNAKSGAAAAAGDKKVKQGKGKAKPTGAAQKKDFKGKK